MGDLIGEVVQSELYYIAHGEFERVARANAPKPALMSLYADLARLNALYMIANAGSGHIGSSFSAPISSRTFILLKWIAMAMCSFPPRVTTRPRFIPC